MDDVDLIKQKIDIVDLIGEFIPIKKAGRNFKANCPFHNEKSPSFVISPERQIWHCFGCQKGGDIFTFVEEFERMDFSESLRFLAQKANITLSTRHLEKKDTSKKERIYEINHLASQFYNFLLEKHKSGKKTYDYVIQRGLNNALISKYLLGYAPAGNSLTTFLLKKKGYSYEELLEAGVATQRGSRVIDFFQNRLIFPIQDARGNFIAFSGRAISSNQQPKYINTKETPVYIKGDTFYGLFQAKDSIKKEGKAIIMEGEFDVITSFKEGITNAIAVKGTALTENQIKLIKRFAKKIIFCFDTDSAGIEAQRRSIALIQKEGIDAGVVIPPLGKDADEILRENPLLFKKSLKNEENIYDFIIKSASQDENPKTVEGKRHILSRTLSFLNDIENEIIKEHYFKKLSNLLDTSLESIQKEALKSVSPQKNEEKTFKKRQTKSRQEMLEDHLLTLIVQYPKTKDAVASATNILGDINLISPNANKIFETIKKHFITADSLIVSEISKKISSDTSATFDLYFLNQIPQFENEEAHLKDIEKTAHIVRTSIIKESLKIISEKIKIAEKKEDENELEQLRNDFNKLAANYN